LWCGFVALGRVVDPDGLGYLGWSGAAAEAFGVAGVCLGEGDGPLVADLLGGPEVDGGGCVPADTRVPVLMVVVRDERVEPLAGVGQGVEPFGIVRNAA
jgi:hypothetical protein